MHVIGRFGNALRAPFAAGLEQLTNLLVALIKLLIGLLAVRYEVSALRSAIIAVGSWGGFYWCKGYAYRVTLGFVSITWLPADIDAVLTRSCMRTPQQPGLSLILSRSERQVGAYKRYALRVWAGGYAIALLLADIDDVLASERAPRVLREK